MSWTEKLKQRWGLTSNLQFATILLVFALTGTTVVFLKKPIFSLMGYNDIRQLPLGVTIAYYIFILPIYQLILLIYGAIFGQFDFFWSFVKKLLNRFRK